MEVKETLSDPRFVSNRFVRGEPHIRFYAGTAIKTHEGVPIGAICVMDVEPRALSESQRRILLRLSKQVTAQLELRLKYKILEEVRAP